MSQYLAEILAACTEVGDCLEWQGRMGSGRNHSTPILKKYIGGRTENLPIVRIVWEAEHGPIPAGKLVYRSCCNARCLTHLKLGVRGDAHRQRKKLGLAAHSPAARAALTRGARGRANVKNSEAKAAEVRSLCADGLRDSEVSQQTGVHKDMVADIRLGRSWKPQVAQGSVFGWRPA